MPELPEVETIKNYLKKILVGKKIVGFRRLDKKQVQIRERDVVGEKILDIERRGKILIFKLSNNKEIYVHLKMTGRLIYTEKLDISKATRAVFEFSNGREPLRTFSRTDANNKNRELLRTEKRTYANYILDRELVRKGYLLFNDARKFGWIKLKAREIGKLGIEPFSKEFNLKNLEKIFRATKRPIKIVLMDQEKIAGIGNIYANEALFLAKINPKKPANKLTKEEIKRLKNSILKVLKKALECEGTSSRFYLKPDQTKGRYQEKFLVYQREGKSCFRCQNKIKRIILGGRSTFYCERCQKG